MQITVTFNRSHRNLSSIDNHQRVPVSLASIACNSKQNFLINDNVPHFEYSFNSIINAHERNTHSDNNSFWAKSNFSFTFHWIDSNCYSEKKLQEKIYVSIMLYIIPNFRCFYLNIKKNNLFHHWCCHCTIRNDIRDTRTNGELNKSLPCLWQIEINNLI